MLDSVCRALGVLVLLSVTACAAPQGPRVRVATASAADIKAHENTKVVWYEFQKGDRVPLQLGLIGMAMIDGRNAPLDLVAARPFWLVVSKDGPMRFSYDGKSLAPEPFARWALVVGADDERAKTGLMMYIGPHDEVPAELR